MIHLITAANRHLYRDEIVALHAERRRAFVEERGWDLTVVGGGEYDAYDDELAAHLVGFDEQGGIAVFCRIRSTTTGGVIPDHFPHLIASDEADPRAVGVFETTRYYCAPHLRGAAGQSRRADLHVAMIEHVRDRGGHRLLGFVDLPLLTHLRRFSGLNLRPVGLPAPYGEDQFTIAFEIGVSEADLAQTRDRLGIFGRRLLEADPGFDPSFDPHLWEAAMVRRLAASDNGRSIGSAANLQAAAPKRLRA